MTALSPIFYSAKTMAFLLDCASHRDIYPMIPQLLAKGVKLENFGRRVRFYADSVHRAFPGSEDRMKVIRALAKGGSRG